MSCFIFLSNTRHLQSLRYLRANFYLAVAALEIELYGSVYFKEAFIFLSTNNSLEPGRALVSHFYDTKIVHLMIICHYWCFHGKYSIAPPPPSQMEANQLWNSDVSIEMLIGLLLITKGLVFFGKNAGYGTWNSEVQNREWPFSECNKWYVKK